MGNSFNLELDFVIAENKKKIESSKAVRVEERDARE